MEPELEIRRSRAQRDTRMRARRGASVRLLALAVATLSLQVMGATPVHAAARATANAPTASAADATAPRPAVPSPAATAAATLKPHKITLRTTFKGMSAGDLELRLTRDDGVWTYETRAHPSFLGRFAVDPNSRERGEFRIGPNGVQPLSYSLDDGTKATAKDARVEYDWTRGRITGVARDHTLDLALEPGTQDALSIRAAVMHDLVAGREPGEYRMLDGHVIKTYVYRRDGTQRMKTPLGEFDTVVYSSKRKDADARARWWKYWYAPALNWLPVRIEQIDKGEPRIVFVARAVEWL